MGTLFINSKNKKKFVPCRLLLNLKDKINLERSDYVSLLCVEKYKKIIKNKKFEISAPTWNENFNLPNRSYSVSDIQEYFEYIIKKNDKVTENHPTRIYENITEIRITFRIKTGNYLEFLTRKTMQLLRSTKSKITKDKDDESVSHLETSEVVLVHFNKIQESCIHFFLINHLGSYQIFHPKILTFLG